MGWEQLLAWVTGRVDEQLRLRVEYLVAENRILRGQVESRLRLTDEQWIMLATIGKKLGKAALEQIASIVTPETILAWHRKLVAAKFDTSKTRSNPTGRPPTDPAVVELVLRMATENPTWGYRRITGELAKLAIKVSHQTVKKVLETHGLDPAPQRKSKRSRADFIKSHTDSMLATDFLTSRIAHTRASAT